LMAQFGDTLSDETLDTRPDLSGGSIGGLMAGTTHFLLFGKADQFHPEIFGNGDLEQMHVKGESAFELFLGRERPFDLGEQPFGFVVGFRNLPGRFTPFGEGMGSQVAIAVQEPFGGLPKTDVLSIQSFLHIDQFGIGQEVADTTEEREGSFFDDGMGSTLDQGEFGEGFLREESLVAEAHESFADLFGFESEIGGAELLVEARVSHAGVDEDTLAREHRKEV
ncbi:MAG: hypothetical protein KDN20_24695, partial [Verrucomicrobiae bacterium]|nr:hypothetical protein [Verrucomicrobiae bacterium]